jgi:hypothetical protein
MLNIKAWTFNFTILRQTSMASLPALLAGGAHCQD